MNKAENALYEIQAMNELAAMDSYVHRLSSLAKLLVTICYIFVVVSFRPYDLSGIIIMVLYPVVAYSLSGIQIRTCFYKLRIVLPLVCAVGLFNPFFDRIPILRLGPIVITSGILSMLTLMLKGIFCLMASFLLIATTTIEDICAAMRRLHLPRILTSLLLLTYRYIALLLEEVSIMTEAYHLRAPGQNGVHYKAWGSFLGQLILRTMDRATALYESMELRGFHGEFYYVQEKAPGLQSVFYTAIWFILFILWRFVPVASLVGGLFL